MAADLDVKRSMDKMYRLQRYIYDGTRKYYLLGRDRLIQDLKARPGELVCEVGCGTARNLVKMAETYPKARFFGMDASDEMLKTAHGTFARKGLSKKIPLAQGYAQNFDPKALFGVGQPFDKLVFSYSLSMIPPWKESLDHGLSLLRPGGEMHIVDFGDQAGLSPAFRKGLYSWLDLFGVHFRPEMQVYLRQMHADGKGILTLKPLYRGYSYVAVFRKSDTAP